MKLTPAMLNYFHFAVLLSQMVCYDSPVTPNSDLINQRFVAQHAFRVRTFLIWLMWLAYVYLYTREECLFLKAKLRKPWWELC